MNNKLVIIIIIIILLFFSSPSSAIENGYARIVYNVRGIQDYDLHWNDRFPQGSTLKIYVEADGVNHRREVAVDYVFIIKDPNNNVVDTATYSNRFHDYRENDFVTYSRNLPADWEDGVYTADIYIFDLMNDSAMDSYYNDVVTSYINGSSKSDIPVMSRSQLANISGTEKNMHVKSTRKTFYVDKYTSKYPIDRFRVENIMIDMKTVPPKIPVHLRATVTNSFYEKGSTSVSLLLDNKLIDSRIIEMEASSSRQIAFEVSSDIEGDHKVEVVPNASNTIGLNLLTWFTVNPEKKIEVPTTFVFKDLQIDNFHVLPDQTVTITVTIENTGQNGSLPVELYINDILEETKDVYLDFSSTSDVKFNVTKADPGVYRVAFDKTNLSKNFNVELPAVTPIETPVLIAEKKRKSELDIVLGLSILVVFIYILRLYLKRKMK